MSNKSVHSEIPECPLMKRYAAEHGISYDNPHVLACDCPKLRELIPTNGSGKPACYDPRAGTCIVRASGAFALYTHAEAMRRDVRTRTKTIPWDAIKAILRSWFDDNRSHSEHRRKRHAAIG